MDLKILSRTQNALFDRVEVTASLSGYDATPSRVDVEKLLCAELKCEPGALVIEEIHQPFGKKLVSIAVRVYPSAETAKKAEPAFKFQRGKAKEAKPTSA